MGIVPGFIGACSLEIRFFQRFLLSFYFWHAICAFICPEEFFFAVFKGFLTLGISLELPHLFVFPVVVCWLLPDSLPCIIDIL